MLTQEGSYLSYLIFAVVLAAAMITFLSIKFRPTANPSKSVDSFQRAIEALAQESESRGRPH